MLLSLFALNRSSDRSVPAPLSRVRLCHQLSHYRRRPLPVAPPAFANGNGHDHKRETEIKIDLTGDPDDLDIKF